MTKKFYMETKNNTLESAILDVWKNAAENNMSGEQSYELGTDRYREHTQSITPGQQTEEVVVETNKNDKSDDGDGLDAVQPKAVKKKFADRKDKDIDNDGDTDDSDEFMHKKRKAISKAMDKDKKEDVKESVSNLRDTIINMWTEASSAVNPKEREELDKAPEKTAKKMKRADEPAPMVATEEVDIDEGTYRIGNMKMSGNFKGKDAEDAIKQAMKKGMKVDREFTVFDRDKRQFIYKNDKPAMATKGTYKEEVDLEEGEMNAQYEMMKKEMMNKVEMMKAEKDPSKMEMMKKEMMKEMEKMPEMMKKEMMGKMEMAMKEEVVLDEAKKEKDEGNAFGKALMAAKEKGEKTFVVAGKKYDVQEELSLENAQQFKVASMKEALAKVWGLDEKHSPEQQAAIAISKKEKSKKENAKTDTGGKMAEIDIDPDLKEKK